MVQSTRKANSLKNFSLYQDGIRLSPFMTYEVKFDIPYRPLGKADIRFVISTDAGVLGTLRVSKGALVWYPKKANYGHKVPWARFAKIAKEFPQTEFRSGT